MKLSAAQPLPTSTPPAKSRTVQPAPPGRSPVQHRRRKTGHRRRPGTHPAAQPHVSKKHQRRVSGSCQRHGKRRASGKRDAQRPSQRNVTRSAQRTGDSERSEQEQETRPGKSTPAGHAGVRAQRAAPAPAGARRRSRQGNMKRNASQGNDQPLETGDSPLREGARGAAPSPLNMPTPGLARQTN